MNGCITSAIYALLLLNRGLTDAAERLHWKCGTEPIRVQMMARGCGRGTPPLNQWPSVSYFLLSDGECRGPVVWLHGLPAACQRETNWRTLSCIATKGPTRPRCRPLIGTPRGVECVTRLPSPRKRISEETGQTESPQPNRRVSVMLLLAEAIVER
jgi:hypothetical protein